MAISRSMVFATFLMLFALVTSAHAGIATYSGFDNGASAPGANSTAAAASFDAAAPGDSIITFESSPLGPFTSLTPAPGVTITGADVNSGNQNILNQIVFLCDPSLCGNNTTQGGSQWLSLFGGTATFTFNSAINSFGAYFGGLQAQGIDLEFTDANGPESVPLPYDFSNGGFAFVGFTDTLAFSSVTVNVSNDIISVDDVRYPANARVPEPATLLLLASGLAGLAGLRCRWTHE